ncbi:MAG: branched-chain amino acid ABC transporter permease [Oscillospiraceae bacterium]|jgi:branched-chain amino acid transport system permease protein|nr:branched-chain amino acid ABC transporter permease [Oscillospiraceae bacterium]
MKRIHLNKASRVNFATYGMVVAAYLVLQLLGSMGMLSSTMRGQLVPICAYVAMALSLNLTVGVLGELSLGHGGFMSVGAFAGAVAAAALPIGSDGLRLACAMVAGALVAALVGVLVGIPVLRLNGDYLAIVTLAFGQIIKSIVENLYIGMDGKGLHADFLNNTMALGEGGRMVLNGPMGVNGIQKISTFTAGFVLVMLILVVIFHLVGSRAGRAIMALRDNRIAAESVGIPVTKYKLMAFVISAAMAGAAGTLFALGQNTITANKFDFNTSILILVFVVLGGQGKMWGSILAATFLTVLPETPAMRGLADYRMLVYAVVMILVMLATNSPAVQDFVNARLRKKKKKEGAGQ